MLGNPLATDIHRVFERDIVKTCSELNTYVAGQNSKDKILRFRRTERFVSSINDFFAATGQNMFVIAPLEVDEKKLLNFALQLSGYIRDAQTALDKLPDFYAHDKDLVTLYHAAANYTVACSGRVKGNKYNFEHHKDYCLWRIDNPQNLAESSFSPVDTPLDANRHTLILSMPFHIKPTQEELQKWTYEYMHDTFSSSVYGKDIDVYVAHFPIEQPRGEKFALTLKTIKNGDDYYEPMDLRLVRYYFQDFIADNLEVDKQGQVVRAEPYSSEKLAHNFRNLTIFGYCSGTAHAHRWVNALHSIGSQIYDRSTLEPAMKNIFVASYAFLPFRENNLYSGTHFMSNYLDDTAQKEPFIKMFNPEMYEKVKYKGEPGRAKITVMPDGRNFIIANALPNDLIIVDRQQRLKRISNQENGHHIAFLTTPNLATDNNFMPQMFANVLENAASGHRGQAIFAPNHLQNPDAVLQNAALFGRRQAYRN